jgi:hypothetical protein
VYYAESYGCFEYVLFGELLEILVSEFRILWFYALKILFEEQALVLLEIIANIALSFLITNEFLPYSNILCD